jgi:hypothetical protein
VGQARRRLGDGQRSGRLDPYRAATGTDRGRVTMEPRAPAGVWVSSWERRAPARHLQSVELWALLTLSMFFCGSLVPRKSQPRRG